MTLAQFLIVNIISHAIASLSNRLSDARIKKDKKLIKELDQGLVSSREVYSRIKLTYWLLLINFSIQIFNLIIFLTSAYIYWWEV